MTHKDLIASVAKQLKQTQKDTEVLMSSFIEILKTEILSDNTVNFQGFGVLELKKNEERITVHPATQIRMLIPPKQSVVFKQSRTLKTKLKDITES